MLKTTFGRVKNKIPDAMQSSYSYTICVNEWSAAKPFKDIPGPSKYQLIRSFFPGGQFYKKSFIDFNNKLRSEYGDIFLVPGLYGKRSVVYSYNPKDFQQVFRTEGMYPIRRGLDVIQFHRENLRKDMFKHATGLVASQGESWSKFRSTVNPIMMHPKTIKMYIPKIDHIAQKFVECIKRIRDPRTLEMPENFADYIRYCTMDSVGLIALDTDLNMIENSEANPKAKIIMESMEEFFQLMLELDFQPSMWKVIPTPKFKRLIKLLDTMNEKALDYVTEAMERLKKDDGKKLESDKSILEKLISRDPLIAMTMAMDTFLAGVDTTSTALAGCLLCLAKNPNKQTKLRQEILESLPGKNSPLTKENMHNLPYLRACIKEAIRLYPIAPANFRTTGQDVVLSGYRIPANTDISMTAQVLFKDPKYFEQPENFLPERWLRSQVSAEDKNCGIASRKDPFVYLPFGFGPRTCIGKRIVDLKIETVLSRLLRNFEIEFNYPSDNIFKTNVINVLAKPIPFKFIDIKY